jgi:orotate phosphoribosyltransferase
MSVIQLLRSKAVVHGRTGSLGAALRGWRIDAASLLADPAGGPVIDALRALALPYRPSQVVGIDRAGTPLAAALGLPATRYLPGRGRCWPDLQPEGRIVVIDDVINTGRTAARAIRVIDALNAEVVAVACLVQYPRGRPWFLRRWPGPVLSLAHLTELGLPHPVHLGGPPRARSSSGADRDLGK